jgi:tetratricopeptide (TPR) repeat protein
LHRNAGWKVADMRPLNRVSFFITIYLCSITLLAFAQIDNNTINDNETKGNTSRGLDPAFIGLLGVLLGGLLGLLTPLITAKIDEAKWEREQASKRDEWLRNRLEEIYSNCIEKLSISNDDDSKAQRWLRILLIYHQDRNSDDYYELYDQVMNLDTGHQLKYKFKELGSNIVEMAAVDPRLIGSGKKSAAQKVFLGKLYLDNGNYGRSIQYFDDAILQNPNYAMAWNFKGDALFNHNELNDAIESYKEAIRINPRFEKALISLGNALGAVKKYKESIEQFDRVLNINPMLPGAWFGKGLALAKENRYNDALSCFIEATKLSPIYSEAWLEMGNTLKEIGRYDEAEDALAEAKKLKDREF